MRKVINCGSSVSIFNYRSLWISNLSLRLGKDFLSFWRPSFKREETREDPCPSSSLIDTMRGVEVVTKSHWPISNYLFNWSSSSSFVSVLEEFYLFFVYSSGFEGNNRGSQITGDEAFRFEWVYGVRHNEFFENKSKEVSKRKLKKIICRNLDDLNYLTKLLNECFCFVFGFFFGSFEFLLCKITKNLSWG